MTKIVICDDQDVVREGLRAILSRISGFEVVGVAADGEREREVLPFWPMV